MGALETKDRLIEQQQIQLDDMHALLTASDAVEQYWKRKTREYRSAAAAAKREMWELRNAEAEKALSDRPAPDDDNKGVKARTLLITIHSVLRTDRSDAVIDSIQAQIEEYWRETGQLRP